MMISDPLHLHLHLRPACPQIVVVSPGNFPYGSNNPSGWEVLCALFSLFPPSLLAKGLSDLGTASQSETHKGITWGEIKSYCDDKVRGEGGPYTAVTRPHASPGPCA